MFLAAPELWNRSSMCPFRRVSIQTVSEVPRWEISKLAGDLIIPVIVPPVLFISGTLIYYDVRLKKEGYDFRSLSVEMGVLPVSPVTSTN